MRTTVVFWLLSLAAAAAVSLVVVQNQRRGARQAIALGVAGKEHLEFLRLQAETRRLAAGQLSETDRRRLEATRAEAESLRSRLAELQRKPPGDDDGAPRSMLAKDWVYAGRSSPRATIESVLWAASRGDADRLADLLGFAPELRAQAESMFSHLPAASQQEYGSPEKVVATLLAGSFPKDPRASQVFVDREWGEQDASITMSVTHSDGESRMNLFRFHNTPDGWKLLIPANVMRDYEKTLLGDPPPSETSSP
jgi:hypothetical protein